MQRTVVVSPRRGRSVLKLSLGISLLAVVTVVAAVFIVGAPEADAAVCSWPGGASWTTGSWTGCGGSYPGANPGDTAQFTFGTTVTVNAAIPNSVIVNETGFGVILNIPSATSLTLEPSSTLSS